jgi:hypothetical protein
MPIIFFLGADGFDPDSPADMETLQNADIEVITV